MNPVTSFLLLIILPLIASPIIYLVGRIAYRRNNNQNPARWLALLVMIALSVILYSTTQAFLSGKEIVYQLGTISLQFDGIALLLSVTITVLSFMVILFSSSYMKNEDGEEKYYALLVAMIGSIIGMGCANDLFNLWVWFETMAVTSYTLVAFYQNQKESLEAGVKYLVQSAAGSVLILLGTALVFMQAGTLNIQELQSMNLGSSPLLLASGALFLIGYGVKTAMVPLHTWLPDAHSQAPSGISAMLSGIVIEAGLIALLRALGILTEINNSWGILLLSFGALNMLVGNLMALRQTQVKRLLAYSSVSHMGYILFGIGIAVSFGQINGAAGSFFHIFNHALMKGLAFLSAGALLYALHIANGNHNPLIIDDLSGASRKYPVIAFALSVAVLALGGLPPLAGFMSKWQILVAGVETGNTAIILLVIFAALNSVLSLGYYAPLVNRMYRYEPSKIVEEGKPIALSMNIPIILMTLAVALLGFWPTLLTWLTTPAANSLLLAFGS